MDKGRSRFIGHGEVLATSVTYALQQLIIQISESIMKIELVQHSIHSDTIFCMEFTRLKVLCNDTDTTFSPWCPNS